MRCKKAVIWLSLLFLVFMMSGCWDTRDINHRVMPVVLGISKDSDQYKVFLQIPHPQQDMIQTKVVVGVGETINEIVDDISADMESSVDLLHVKVIVIDRLLAEEGVKDLISGIMRSRDVSSKALVAICNDDIDRFFESMEKNTSPRGTTLLDFFEKNAGWDPQVALTRVWEVYRSIHSYTRDVAIPMLCLGETTLVDHVGSAVIKNGKMVEEINPNETLLYNAFKGESTEGKIEVLNEGSVLILGNTIEHTSEVRKEPFLYSKIKLDVMILETKGDPTEKMIEKGLEKLLTDRLNKMFSKLQNSEADILGLGQLFRKEIPRMDLKEWRSKYYQNLSTDFVVDVDIRNSGNLKNPG
ncbi:MULTISPECIES: Ger(x)C family spore germination protein [unclassified Rossellomorea]|uniref:Ger(x)C family spore germination protein n=1 Tax=unclassified Rossellomorea TaxID=2837526 RepID=UPI0026044292|nr:Ger(x)C family spore germination protein [uncultured Rossellomorea sp.]